jgi:hypothetical protein
MTSLPGCLKGFSRRIFAHFRTGDSDDEYLEQDGALLMEDEAGAARKE